MSAVAAALPLAGTDSPPVFGPASRLAFGALTIVPEDDGFLVGNPQTGVFLLLPEVGVVAIRELQAGKNLAEAGAAASAFAGEEVDVVDFAATLAEAGLVADVDGTSVAPAVATGWSRTWLAGVPTEIARPFFSTPAWVAYGLLLAGSLAIFATRPAFRPTFEDSLFYPNPAVCVVVLTVLGFVLATGHELCHWLAARAVGVSARFSAGRRYFFPVLETDLSQLWSVPRRRRFGPFLGGMAFDTVVLAGALGLRVAWGEGLIDVPPLLYRLLGALVLRQVFVLGWQGLVFLRTDLYVALVSILGCYNLRRVNQLTLKRRIRRLRPEEAAELAAAHPRDLSVARWFGFISIAGLIWVIFMFVTFFVPSTVVMAGWIFGSLIGAPISGQAFWEALTIGMLTAMQGFLPFAIWGWQRFRRRQGVLAS
jgi:hypothetical protein